MMLMFTIGLVVGLAIVLGLLYYAVFGDHDDNRDGDGGFEL